MKNMKNITKASQVRDVICDYITLAQNGQDNLVICAIKERLPSYTASEAKRAYHAQKDRAIELYRNEVATIEAELPRNKNGDVRKTITMRKGKDTFANRVRDVLSNTITNGGSLGEACNIIEDLVVEKYTANGKAVGRKPAYFRLVARNELERLTPSIQATLGVPVSTPTELKIATRNRDWKRKN